jgi:hypothetical protein
MTCLPEVGDVQDLEAARVEAHLFVVEVEEEVVVDYSLIALNPAERKRTNSSTRSLGLIPRRPGHCQPIFSGWLPLIWM